MTSKWHREYVYIGMAGSEGVEGHGLYRMEAEGGEWVELTNGLPLDPEVMGLALHHEDSQIIFAGTTSGLYRSEDQGDHWERLNVLDKDNPIWSVTFHPKDPRIMLAGDETPEIYRSDDGGETWRPLDLKVQFPSITLRPEEQPKHIMAISIDLHYPDEMYAAIEVGGLIRSLDGGESWEGISEGFYVNDDPLDVHGVVASRAQPHTVYAITRIGMFRSADRGDHWEHVGLESLSPSGTYCRALREAPDDPSTFYLATGTTFRSQVGALYRSRNLAYSWERLDLGYAPKSTMMGVAINRARPLQIYCCTGDGEVFGSQNGGVSWMAYPLPESAQDLKAVLCG